MATKRRVGPKTRKTARARAATAPLVASSDRLLDQYSGIVRTGLNGNLRLATRAQRVLAEFASTSAKSRPEDIATMWTRWVEFSLTAYDSYVSQSLAYWDHVLAAAETSVVATPRRAASPSKVARQRRTARKASAA